MEPVGDDVLGLGCLETVRRTVELLHSCDDQQHYGCNFVLSSCSSYYEMLVRTAYTLLD